LILLVKNCDGSLQLEKDFGVELEIDCGVSLELMINLVAFWDWKWMVVSLCIYSTVCRDTDNDNES
jgi:hypothetical protein